MKMLLEKVSKKLQCLTKDVFCTVSKKNRTPGINMTLLT